MPRIEDEEMIAKETGPAFAIRLSPPTPVEIALDQVDAWLAAPGVVLLAESEGYWPLLRETVLVGRVAGGRVHDARVAALARHHQVTELWSADRDFGRFPDVTVRNPLIA